MSESITLETFAPRLNDRFQLSAGPGQTIDVTLVEANALGGASGARSSRRTPFALLFLGPPAPIWPQRIYRLDGEGFASLDLFLVPLGPRDGGMMYEAIFT